MRRVLRPEELEDYDEQSWCFDMEHNLEWLDFFLEDLANGKRTVYAKGEDTAYWARRHLRQLKEAYAERYAFGLGFSDADHLTDDLTTE